MKFDNTLFVKSLEEISEILDRDVSEIREMIK